MINVNVIIPTILVGAVIQSTVLVSAVIEATVIDLGSATVENSTGTYNVDFSGTLILPDNNYKVFVNSVLYSTSSGASIEETNINIFN